jgi:hypothetical protein
MFRTKASGILYQHNCHERIISGFYFTMFPKFTLNSLLYHPSWCYNRTVFYDLHIICIQDMPT